MTREDPARQSAAGGSRLQIFLDFLIKLCRHDQTDECVRRIRAVGRILMWMWGLGLAATVAIVWLVTHAPGWVWLPALPIAIGSGAALHGARRRWRTRKNPPTGHP